MGARIVSFEIPTNLVDESELLAVQLGIPMSELACRAFTEYVWTIQVTSRGERFTAQTDGSEEE